MTFAEISFGIELVDEAGKRGDELNHWLAHQVGLMFEQRSLPVQVAAAGRGSCKVGYTFAQGDGALPRPDHPVPRLERL